MHPSVLCIRIGSQALGSLQALQAAPVLEPWSARLPCGTSKTFPLGSGLCPSLPAGLSQTHTYLLKQGPPRLRAGGDLLSLQQSREGLPPP